MIPVLQTTVIIALLYSRQHPKAVSDTCLYEEMGKEERPPNCTKDVKGRASIFPKAGFLVFPPRSVGCHLSHASILFCQVLLPTLPWSGSPRPPPALLQHPVQSIRTERPGSPITRDKDLANRPASQWSRALKPFLRGEAGLLLTLVIWMLFSCCCQCRIVSIRYTHMLMFPTSTHLPTLWTKVHKDV